MPFLQQAQLNSFTIILRQLTIVARCFTWNICVCLIESSHCNYADNCKYSVILRYDWIECFHCSTGSAQIVPAHLQVFRDYRYCRYMFHVKHLSQFDRKTSIQICKQSQLSRTLLIELEDSNSIDIRGDMFHVKHILIRQKYIWQMYWELHSTVKIAVITRYFA